MKSKEALEAQVGGLESKIQELTNELSTAQYDLRVVNKPIMTENIYSLLIDTVRTAVLDISFSEGDFDYDMTIGYDNRVELDCLTFNQHDAVADDIIRCIDNEFRMIENEENPTIDEQVKE